MDFKERAKSWVPDYVKYRLELRRCDNAQAKLDLKESPDTEDNYWSGVRHKFIKDSESLYEWRQLVQTRYLQKVAARLSVSMPDPNDANLYDRVDYDNDESMPRYLKQEGVKQLTDAIRKERRSRREEFGYWFGIVVGLIGALTGLVSTFKG
ncbi:hypothetical protein [Pseudomonas xanthosomatis]|uniref:hypothetical protein n=1 Tax=Pseudomonas xanthosomatis TaxID=2842356 RepID=UPI003514A9BF